MCHFVYRLGDQIVKVNGNSLLDVTHAEAVEILKNSGKRVELVRTPLMCAHDGVTLLH